MLPYIAAPWIRHGWVLHFNVATLHCSHGRTRQWRRSRLSRDWPATRCQIKLTSLVSGEWLSPCWLIWLYDIIWGFITEYIGNILGIYWEYIGNMLGICGNHMELSILITIYHAKSYQPTSMDDRGFWTLLRVYRRGDEEKSKFRSG